MKANLRHVEIRVSEEEVRAGADAALVHYIFQDESKTDRGFNKDCRNAGRNPVPLVERCSLALKSSPLSIGRYIQQVLSNCLKFDLEPAKNVLGPLYASYGSEESSDLSSPDDQKRMYRDAHAWLDMVSREGLTNQYYAGEHAELMHWIEKTAEEVCSLLWDFEGFRKENGAVLARYFMATNIALHDYHLRLQLLYVGDNKDKNLLRISSIAMGIEEIRSSLLGAILRKIQARYEHDEFPIGEFDSSMDQMGEFVRGAGYSSGVRSRFAEMDKLSDYWKYRAKVVVPLMLTFANRARSSLMHAQQFPELIRSLEECSLYECDGISNDKELFMPEGYIGIVKLLENDQFIHYKLDGTRRWRGIHLIEDIEGIDDGALSMEQCDTLYPSTNPDYYIIGSRGCYIINDDVFATNYARFTTPIAQKGDHDYHVVTSVERTLNAQASQYCERYPMFFKRLGDFSPVIFVQGSEAELVIFPISSPQQEHEIMELMPSIERLPEEELRMLLNLMQIKCNQFEDNPEGMWIGFILSSKEEGNVAGSDVVDHDEETNDIPIGNEKAEDTNGVSWRKLKKMYAGPTVNGFIACLRRVEGVKNVILDAKPGAGSHYKLVVAFDDGHIRKKDTSKSLRERGMNWHHVAEYLERFGISSEEFLQAVQLADVLKIKKGKKSHKP